MSGTAESLNLGFPPIVTETTGRTHCDACQAPLDAAVMHKCDGNKPWVPPRRIRVDQWTQMEHAIAIARMVIEHGPPDIRLTQAGILMEQAQNRVADYVDGVP